VKEHLNIAYVGNFSLPWCTEVHLARTLEQLGHTVHRLQENAYTPASLRAELGKMTPDFFLYTRTWGQTVRMEHLKWLRAKEIPSVSYHLDLYYGLKNSVVAGRNRQDGIGSDPFWLTDFVFSPDGDPESEEFFKGKGVNHFWMPPGVVRDECEIRDEPIQHDVIFVGSRQYHPEWPYRPHLLDWLEGQFADRFSWHGRPGEPVRGISLNKLYSGSKIAIGDSLVIGFTHRSYTSDRRYEAPGRGAFQIGPDIQGLDDGFVDGENAILYQFGDLDGLHDRIEYYLEHDEERERIRRAGHEHVKANHTYTNRLSRMLEILQAQGAL